MPGPKTKSRLIHSFTSELFLIQDALKEMHMENGAHQGLRVLYVPIRRICLCVVCVCVCVCVCGFSQLSGLPDEWWWGRGLIPFSACLSLLTAPLSDHRLLGGQSTQPATTHTGEPSVADAGSTLWMWAKLFKMVILKLPRRSSTHPHTPRQRALSALVSLRRDPFFGWHRSAFSESQKEHDLGRTGWRRLAKT